MTAPQTDNPATLMSAQAVAELHAAFMQRIRAQAEDIAAKAGAPDVVEHLVKLQLAAARKHEKIGQQDAIALAKGGTPAITARTWEIEAKKFFSPEQQKKLDDAAAKRAGHPRVAAVFGHEKRLYIDLADASEPSATQKNIAKHLAHHGYRVTDYVRGYATDAAGKQQFRIGKLLQDHASFLLPAFQEDTSRVENTMVVISQDADDIARMSTGRSWVSCMSAWKTEFDSFAHQDLAQGTLVAYLVRKDDPEVTAPLARVLIKPYTDKHPLMRKATTPQSAPPVLSPKASPLRAIANMFFGNQTASVAAPAPAAEATHTVFIPEKKVHGLRSDRLYETALAFAMQHLNKNGPDGAYYLDPRLYCDSNGAREYAKQGDTLRAVKSFDSNPF